jgi:hypothetical protein
VEEAFIKKSKKKKNSASSTRHEMLVLIDGLATANQTARGKRRALVVASAGGAKPSVAYQTGHTLFKTSHLSTQPLWN